MYLRDIYVCMFEIKYTYTEDLLLSWSRGKNNSYLYVWLFTTYRVVNYPGQMFTMTPQVGMMIISMQRWEHGSSKDLSKVSPLKCKSYNFSSHLCFSWKLIPLAAVTVLITEWSQEQMEKH